MRAKGEIEDRLKTLTDAREACIREGRARDAEKLGMAVLALRWALGEDDASMDGGDRG